MSDSPLLADDVILAPPDPQAEASPSSASVPLREILVLLANTPEEVWADIIMVALLKSRGAVSSATQIPGDEVDVIRNEFRKFLALAGVFALLLSGDVALFVDPEDGKVEVRMPEKGKALAVPESPDDSKPATE